MKWKIEFEKNAAKEIKKLDPGVVKRLLSFLTRIEKLDDPRSVGEALKGSSLNTFWKYRVGDFRLICEIRDATILIIVVKVGHRKDIYR
ncbi:MAG: type II toxin-antitoxin system RelE/ParE family toxin [Oligoflexales bacterium]|nr:type II toxin-antitoxin system RelE/ParE family toxin [Oligoflexales bacterium]